MLTYKILVRLLGFAMKKNTQILRFGGDLVKRVVGEAWKGRNKRGA